MAETEELQVVKEGTPLNLICEAEGNPEQFRYKWSVDGHAVNGKCTDSHYQGKIFHLGILCRGFKYVDCGREQVPDRFGQSGNVEHEDKM